MIDDWAELEREAAFTATKPPGGVNAKGESPKLKTSSAFLRLTEGNKPVDLRWAGTVKAVGKRLPKRTGSTQ